MPTLITHLRQDQIVAEFMHAARTYCRSEPVEARMLRNQGMFSLTGIVTLEDKSKFIVQLKDNEIDLTRMALARAFLGSVVPYTHSAKTENVFFAYVTDYIEGTCWADLKSPALSEDVSVASQIGSLMWACTLGDGNVKSAGVVDNYIMPRLSTILEKEHITDVGVRERVERLSDKMDQLRELPLALCHIDINARNIILDGGPETKDKSIERRIVGLVDWEYAGLLPLGTNAWYIRYLSVPTVGGKDRVVDKTEPMADAFWKALTAKVPKDLHRNLIVAMQVGFVITNTFFEGGTVNDTAMAQFSQRYDWFTNYFEPLCAA